MEKEQDEEGENVEEQGIVFVDDGMMRSEAATVSAEALALSIAGDGVLTVWINERKRWQLQAFVAGIADVKVVNEKVEEVETTSEGMDEKVTETITAAVGDNFDDLKAQEAGFDGRMAVLMWLKGSRGIKNKVLLEK